MIELIIFHLHILAALYAFTKNWQERRLKDAVLAVLIIGLFFSIGWALTRPVAGILLPDAWNTPIFNVDTLSLVLLIIPESFFFYVFFIKDKNTSDIKQP